MILMPFFIIAILGGGGGSSSTESSSASSTDALAENSAWDGSVYYVKEYLKSTLKDPDSYASTEWRTVRKLDDGNFKVRHKFRAKNSFGGYSIENHIYVYTSSGKIISDTKLGG